MNRYKVVIDAGHGFFPNYKDSGAIGATGTKEADINLKVARLLFSLLSKDFNVTLVPDLSDPSIYNINSSLSQRVDIANKIGADIFISIHCNSAANPSARGTETFAYRPETDGARLATLIQNSIISKVPLTNRGVKFADFFVLRKTTMPAALVELAFINNPTEEALLLDSIRQRLWAEGIMDAVYQYFGVDRKMTNRIFNDVDPKHWAAESIHKLYERGIISGDGQGNYLPQRTATRQEIAVVTNKAVDYIFAKLAQAGIKIEE